MVDQAWHKLWLVIRECTMSYYIDHIIECDLLTFDRMVEYWKQKGWRSICEVSRPRWVWIASEGAGDGVKAGTYLLYLVVSHQPNHWGLTEWLTDELGVDLMHFSIWTQEMYEESWRHDDEFVPDSELPDHTVPVKYVNHEKVAPEGYTTYEDCMIAVDTKVWKDISVDYTRDVGLQPRSPEEETLLQINDELRLIEGLLECLLERFEECLD